MEAAKQDGNALQFASAELKGDREIVMEAVEQWGFALQYASHELQGDREIVTSYHAERDRAAVRIGRAEVRP